MTFFRLAQFDAARVTLILRLGVALCLLQPVFAVAESLFSDSGADSCLLCHRDAVTLAVFEGEHGRPNDTRGPFGPGQLQCEACHGPGGRHSKRLDRDDANPAILSFGRGAPVPPRDRSAACIGCHDDTASISWHGGAHDIADVSCDSCHTIHSGSETVVNRADEFGPCLDCHQRQRMALAMPYTHPNGIGAMTCSDCHSPHANSNEFQLTQATVNETCYTCHADKRGPVLWEHAPVAEDCSICHDSHGSNHPAMLTQRGPYLCQACHTQAGHPSIAYAGDGLPTGASPSIFLLGGNCLNCHTQVHGSNHPSGSKLMR